MLRRCAALAVLSTTACTAAVEDGAVDELEVGVTSQALSGWSAPTSEEYARIECQGGALVNGASCAGNDCDNIQLWCSENIVDTNGGATVWTQEFSEEGAHQGMCPANAWVTGLQCTGSNCDNISLRCYQPATARVAVNCHWTPWFSEENGGQQRFGADYYARGAQCREDHCDDMSYNICKLCALNQAACGSNCYSPASQVCLGGVVCAVGQARCGSRCYNPATQVCLSGTVCRTGETLCFGRCVPADSECDVCMIKPYLPQCDPD